MTDIWVWTIWTQPEDQGAGMLEQVDVSGFDVEATDGHIGKVDAATYEAGRSCLVVDTGFWIFGTKRMIPAGMVERVEPEQRTVHLACTKEQVKDAPEYDAARHDDVGHRDEVGEYFSAQRYRGMRGDPIGPTPGPGSA